MLILKEEELQRDTNISCQTIDAYLQTPLKSLNKNELIAVDEAGMISSSQMQALLERAVRFVGVRSL